MKNLLGLGLVVLMMASCSKDNKTNKKLDGTWNATSVTINGTETFGSEGLTTKWNTTFKQTDGAEGDYTINANVLGTDATYTGSYVVSEDGEVITMTDSDNEKTTADLTLDGDEQTLSSTDSDGNKTVIKATKQ